MLRPIVFAILCSAVAMPATAEEAAVADQSAAANRYELANPATAAEAAQPLQSIVVMVDGEPRSWAPLEKGTDVAWAAYMKGDFPRAVPVFARLAEIGHPVAQWLMGNIYFFGQGVPKDYAKSKVMFEAAATQGYFAAFAPTAQMYLQGFGTAVEPAKAYYWYNIAAAMLPDSAERTDMMNRRESTAALLTPAQVEAAQKRANIFKPKQTVPPDPEDVAWMQE
jgi:Sel1 repeat